MKIIDNSNPTFGNLIIGDVFTPNDSLEYYMRINNHTNSANRAVNAINLEYGYDAYFLDESIVKKIDATLVIGVTFCNKKLNTYITEEESETKEESKIEKLKKMTLVEMAEHCYSRKNKACANCPIYSECDDYDVPKTFENLYAILNE